jgi:hypothetical protein
MAAASVLILVGLSPAFALDPVATQAGGSRGAAAAEFNADLAVPPCPTRFDYLVLASFADSASLLSLSTYHFQSEVRFGTIPATGLLRVDYKDVSGAGACRYHDASSRRQIS